MNLEEKIFKVVKVHAPLNKHVLSHAASFVNYLIKSVMKYKFNTCTSAISIFIIYEGA